MLKALPENCVACGACRNICPVDAIQMIEKQDGFRYPEVNMDACIQCGRCVEVCPIDEKKKSTEEKAPTVYAMQSKQMDLRFRSTSGGAFSELANIVLQEGGCVAGAVYTEHFFVEHQMIEKAKDLERLRRSKYQQSEIGWVFRSIKERLVDGRSVLFCGTPCQTAGLKAFLEKEYEQLYNIDFICRGVPSPRLFQSYLQSLEIQYGSKASSVWMKNKQNGWHSLTTVIGFANGREYIKDGFTDPYVQIYLKYNMGIRNSCYSCQFKGHASIADITLGDFWGLESEMDDNMGTSVLICRTKKGKALAEKIKATCRIVEKDIETVKRGNPCLTKSIKKPGYHADVFYEILNRDGFATAYQWVIKQSEIESREQIG